MISIKDIPIVLSILGPVLTGGFYVHDIKRDVAELGREYRSHVTEQQEVSLTEKRWKLEDRLQKHPGDLDSLRELETVNILLEKNQKQQEQLKGGK
jgi:glycosyltransferase A (GT-A) superfamily protein (DUF2064 family)